MSRTENNLEPPLLLAFTPRPINTEAQSEATQAVVDQLLDQSSLSEDEQDYLNLLGTLIYEYEAQTVDILDIAGVELLRVLMEERGLRQKELVSIFKTESIVSDVINRKRSLTVEHIQKLSQFFHVSPAVFFKV
ncbi:MAG: helix-turn-helix domain-containing protein [Cyanobacteria bacterium J06626_23]